MDNSFMLECTAVASSVVVVVVAVVTSVSPVNRIKKDQSRLDKKKKTNVKISNLQIGQKTAIFP